MISFCVVYFFYFFFFFKQKTAYEMLRSLVGSEMCIRDRFNMLKSQGNHDWKTLLHGVLRITLLAIGNMVAQAAGQNLLLDAAERCLLYTSDAADEEDSVDLGGRRIIKKKRVETRLRDD
eukprot:TRINITY_DN47565_c0_g1_i1.p1 TRINITY_DN47565_c0_g1~~TRINITY_DN47565_c0_g1_i1.p1  ORF type:complete len:120 (-),score=49.82 TRINITY_DN47565_c0_g1_i1:5-364(-)